MSRCAKVVINNNLKYMNKSKILALALLLVLGTQAYAEENERATVGATEVKTVELERGSSERSATSSRDNDEDINDADDADKVNNGTTTDKELKDNEGRGDERRSEVAKYVKELLSVADRQGGIGEQVRLIARDHEKDVNDTENAVKEIKDRNSFTKFFFGPDYKKVSEAESKLNKQAENLAELIKIKDSMATGTDKTILEIQISAMQAIKAELEKEVTESQKGVSLFGWLNRLFNK